jgi:hypothetical protein
MSSNQRPDTLMQDRIIQIDKSSCTARPDHTFRSKAEQTRNEHISSEMRSRADIRHPFCSSGGNLGNGRTRTAMYTDSIEQLRGTAGARQITVRAETALAAFTTPSNGGWIMFGKYPS